MAGQRKSSAPRESAEKSVSVAIGKVRRRSVARCPKAAKPEMLLGEIDTYGELQKKTGYGLLDRDHQPSKAALKKRAVQIKGKPLSAVEARKIENRAQAVAIPKNVHSAGPTYGGKNTPALQLSDASDLAAAARRDADAMVKNGKRLDPANEQIYIKRAKQMKAWANNNKKIDKWLQGILDEER